MMQTRVLTVLEDAILVDVSGITEGCLLYDSQRSFVAWSEVCFYARSVKLAGLINITEL